ncbi:MAG: hypothetical protein QF704_00080 [Anaerolineales bacterium]|jgi:hypothetical protein|nr:hypothetical protein [Anaerolineales bacterium]
MRVEYRVYKENNKYIATAYNGWWIAYGNTKKQAVEKLIKHIKKEISYVI